MSSAWESGTSKRLAAAGAFLVLGAAFAPLALPAAAGAGVEWRIETAQTIENETRTVDGPVLVAQGGVLTLRNATLLFELDRDGGLKLEVLPGGALILENATLRPTDAGAQFYWNFLVAGRLDARGADIGHLRGDAGLGGLETTGSDILIEDSTIHDSRYYAVMVHAGAPTLRNTTIETQVVGVFATPGTSPRLDNVTIRNSTGFGLKMNDATPVVRNLTVEASGGIAVGAAGSSLDIEGCKISGTLVGVDAVLGSTGRVERCEFLTVGTALRANTSPVRLAHSTVLSSTVGVNATSSAVVVEANTFLDVDVGVRAAGEQAPGEPGQGLSNTFEGTGVGFEVFVPSFFLEHNSFAPAMVGARIFHTMTLVIVLASGEAASRARVEIKDGLGATVFTGVADQSGNITTQLEEYRLLSNGTRRNVTPHEVRFQVGNASQNATLNATSDRVEKFTLTPATAGTPPAVSREGLLLLAAIFGLAGLAGALGLRARRNRAKEAADLQAHSGGRRRRQRPGR